MLMYSVLLLIISAASANVIKASDHYQEGHHHRVATVQHSIHQPLTRHQVNAHSQQSYTDSSFRHVPINPHHQRTVTLVHPQTSHQSSVHQSQDSFPHHNAVSQNVDHSNHDESADVTARHGVKPQNTVATARIIQQDAEVNPDGTFLNVWNSENGISVQEHGTVKHVGDVDVIALTGEISYTDDEGHTYHLRYVADENGFRPEGDHLPTPPPIPQGIARGLEFIAAHPYVEQSNGQVGGQSSSDSTILIDN